MGFLNSQVETVQPSADAYDEQKISRLSDELSKLGYWDDYQNRAALTQSKYNIKNAISLIVQGKVPDLEQGGGGGYCGPDQQICQGHELPPCDPWMREFIVQKFSWQNKAGGAKREESAVPWENIVCRFLMTRDGLQAWTTKEGCVWEANWRSISSFGVSADSKTLVLTTGNKVKDVVGDMSVHSKEADKLLDAVVDFAKRLAAELKAEKSR